MYLADFWTTSDQKSIRRALREIDAIRVWCNRFENVQTLCDEFEVLYYFLKTREIDNAEVKKAYDFLIKALELLEFQKVMQSPENSLSAIIEIKTDWQGMEESTEWSYTLMRMYSRWAQKKQYKVQQISPQSRLEMQRLIVLEITGTFAYGQLKSEIGEHCLFSVAPFDLSGTSQVSCASVFVYPLWDNALDFEVNPVDIRQDTFRYGGVAGKYTQNGVRLTHLPSGIQTESHQAGSQMHNIEKVTQMLYSRLYDAGALTGNKELVTMTEANNRIREYILHPDKMVKDLRTGFEHADVQSVLDGELDEYMKVFLMRQ